MTFEPVEHTGDLALRLRAGDLGGLVAAGVEGIRSLLFEGSPGEDAATAGCSFHIAGVDREDALVQALAEALHAMQEGGLYPLETRARADGSEIAVTLRGVAAGPSGVRRVEEIKAVTYHAVAIREREGQLETVVVFDV